MKPRYAVSVDHWGAWLCFWLVGVIGFFGVRYLDARDARRRFEEK